MSQLPPLPTVKDILELSERLGKSFGFIEKTESGGRRDRLEELYHIGKKGR